MSGIYGFAAPKSVSNPTTLLGKMLDAIRSPEPMTNYHWTTKDACAGLGALHPTRIGEPGHFAQDLPQEMSCVFDGVIYRDADGPAEDMVEPDGAAFLLKRYLESGTACLRDISGSFNVAWWDARVRRLILANDRVGHRPLFFGLQAGTLVFASFLARVMAADIITPEIDVEGFADLLNYEYVLGERTLFENVRVLPPASILTFENGRVDVQQYWSLDWVEPHGRYDEQRLDELTDAFKTAVKRSIRPGLNCAISLTGGLDSRCMAAAAANQKLSFATHTGGQPDSTDVVLARKVAARVGAPHFFEFISPHSVGEWLVPMVLHQGGIIATLHSHPCQYLYSSPPFDAIVQGTVGGVTRSHWLSPAALEIKDSAGVQEFVKHRISSTTARRQDLAQLWRSELQHLGVCAPEEHLRTLISRYHPQGSPLVVMDYLALNERARKFLNKAIMIVRVTREAYFPYLDHQWLETLLAVPVSERAVHRIQVDLIKRLFPPLLDIPFEKNLIPLSASRRKIRMIELCRAVRERVWQRFRFIGRGPIKVPNHRYSQWIRNQMRPTLEELLYNPNAAFRAYLRWDTVEALLDQHFSGEEDWEHLVGALAVFEIAHRLWVNPQ